MTAPPDLALLVREADWQRTVVAALRAHGWLVFHDRMAYRSEPGYPDLTAVHVGQRRVLWLELKTERGKISPAQSVWLETLVAAGQEAHCLRPRDWDRFTRLLTRGPEDA